MAAIDVNMGCPKAFSVHAGMGSALLTQADKVKEVRSFQTVRRKNQVIQILTSLKAAAQVPISCKIRVLNDVSFKFAL